MKTVLIPNTDLKVSPVCLGSTDIGAGVSTTDSFALFDAFVKLGGNFIDTAHVYSNWLPGPKSISEKTIGQWLKASGLRDQMVIGTKGAHPEIPTMHIPRMSPAEINQDVNESLEYLQIEQIDLYWLHRDAEAVPVGEIIDTLNEQVQAGKIRYFGCSNWSIERIKAALDYSAKKGVPSFVANQPQWSLADPDMNAIADKTICKLDDEGLAFHKRTNMALIPYSSQAKGFFTKLDKLGIDGVSAQDRKVYHHEPNIQRFVQVQELARKHGVTVNEIALSYVISQPFPTDRKSVV